MTKLSNNIYTIQNKIMENNSFIIIVDNKCYIVDPSWNSYEIIKFIKLNNLIYQGTILTHCHFDHCAEVDVLIKQFQNNKIYVSKFCKKIVCHGVNALFFNENIDLKAINFCYVENNEEIDHIKFILTPGHSEDSMCILYNNILITGDHLFIHDIGRTDFMFSDPEKMQASLRKIYQLFKNQNNILLCPGHGDFEKIEKVLKNNIYLKNIC